MTTREDFQADPSDPRHGTDNGYANLKCRCERCRARWTESCLQRRVNRATAPKDPDDPRHGTYSFYVNHSCRCDACRKANTDRAKSKRNSNGS